MGKAPVQGLGGGLQYTEFSYSGTGETTLKLSVGFTPNLMIIFDKKVGSNLAVFISGGYGKVFYAPSINNLVVEPWGPEITLDTSGYSVKNAINSSVTTYQVIAVKF